MGVKVREKVKGSGVWWVFVNHGKERTSSMIGSEPAAQEVKEMVEAQLKLGQYVFPKYEKPVEQEKPTVQEYFEKLNGTTTRPRFGNRLRTSTGQTSGFISCRHLAICGWTK